MWCLLRAGVWCGAAGWVGGPVPVLAYARASSGKLCVCLCRKVAVRPYTNGVTGERSLVYYGLWTKRKASSLSLLCLLALSLSS